jgi:hypothetical protein
MRIYKSLEEIDDLVVKLHELGVYRKKFSVYVDPSSLAGDDKWSWMSSYQDPNSKPGVVGMWNGVTLIDHEYSQTIELEYHQRRIKEIAENAALQLSSANRLMRLR